MSLTDAERAQIQELQARINQTRRAISPGLEGILYEPIEVLDHGFIRVIDYMGNDEAIVQAARVSYGKGTKQVSGDKILINYLMRHRHTSPFEMCEIKLHVKMPIFVARQWIRHRTANVNEYSARYSVLDREFYIPDPEHVTLQSAVNRQGGEEPVDPAVAAYVRAQIELHAGKSFDLYDAFLNADNDPDKPTIARELSRIVVPLNTYSQWYWKIDLHNLFHFISLRADPHAQYEIRAYADILFDIAKKWVPTAAAAFEEYVMNAAHLSKTAFEVVKRMLAGEQVTEETSGLGKREWREFAAHLGLEK